MVVDLPEGKEFLEVCPNPPHPLIFEPLKTQQTLKMGPVKHDSIEISHPALKYGKQCNNAMLAFRTLANIDLLHDLQSGIQV